MKRTPRYMLGILLVLLLLASCQERPKEPKSEPVEEVEVSAPDQIISLNDADSLYVNYTNRRANSIAKMEMQHGEDSEPFEPTRFVTVDIEVMKQYIKFVEQEAKKGGTEVDSLRIYLGNYGNMKKDWKKNNRNTMFILPAAKAEGGYGGIYIGEDGKAKLMRNYFKGSQEGEPKSEASLLPILNSGLMQGGGSLIMNDLGNSPPPKGDF